MRFGIRAGCAALALAVATGVGAYGVSVRETPADPRILASVSHASEVSAFPDELAREIPQPALPEPDRPPVVQPPTVVATPEAPTSVATPAPRVLSAPVAIPQAPVAAPVVAAPEPRVEASRETLYGTIATAFPEQPDKAYRVVMCESGGYAPTNTGNGYYGLWQFDLPTWRSVGGTGLPSDASATEQVMRARMLYDARGWAPWGCA